MSNFTKVSTIDEDTDDDYTTLVENNNKICCCCGGRQTESSGFLKYLCNWRLLLSQLRTEPRENVGSRARDHLANERTFLAWLRTAVAAVGLGLAVAKLASQKQDKIAGVVFILLGASFLIYAVIRYLQVLTLLEKGYFEANKTGIVFIAMIGLVASVTALVIAWI